MSLVGELTYFLGFQVKQMKEGIFISLNKYAKNIVKKFGVESARHKRTPIANHIKMTKDDQGVDVDQSYLNIGRLIYLTSSYLNITFSVGVCAPYKANPKFSYLTHVKRIIKYINGTYDYGILYSHHTNTILVSIVILIVQGILKIERSLMVVVSF